MNNNRTKNIITIIAGLLLTIVMIPAVQEHFHPMVVNGNSMFPYLRHNDCLIVEKIDCPYDYVDYGDVIIFEKDGRFLIKRVIGKPEDNIAVKGGAVYRNGHRIEDYVDDSVVTNGEMTVNLEEDEYFVLGDNRDYSMDSRDEDVGPVKQHLIYGKAIYRVSPNRGLI